MDDWKRAYSTFIFYAIAVAGAVLMAVEHVTAQGVDVPAWVLPIVGAVGVFLRALPQDKV